MSWIDRTNKQKDAEKEFEKLCQRKDISLARSGIEQLLQDKKFKERIDKLEDETSKKLRFFPDFILLDKKGWLVEVKNSKTIEKTAYDVYINLSMIGYNVALVILSESSQTSLNPEFQFVNIEDLKIKYQENNPIIIDDKEIWEVVFPPIFDNKWTAPRGIPTRDNPEWNFCKEWTQEKYYEWKKKTGGSGTTFGYIDFENTNFKILN